MRLYAIETREGPKRWALRDFTLAETQRAAEKLGARKFPPIDELRMRKGADGKLHVTQEVKAVAPRARPVMGGFNGNGAVRDMIAPAAIKTLLLAYAYARGEDALGSLFYDVAQALADATSRIGDQTILNLAPVITAEGQLYGQPDAPTEEGGDEDTPAEEGDVGFAHIACGSCGAVDPEVAPLDDSMAEIRRDMLRLAIA